MRANYVTRDAEWSAVNGVSATAVRKSRYRFTVDSLIAENEIRSVGLCLEKYAVLLNAVRRPTTANKSKNAFIKTRTYVSRPPRIVTSSELIRTE